MKVLKKGRAQRGKSWGYACSGAGNGGGGCGTKLLVSEYDLYRTSHYDYGGGVDHYTTFCCSECGTETDVTNYGAELKGKRPSERQRKAIALKQKPAPNPD